MSTVPPAVMENPPVRVLVVDDSAFMRVIISRHLSSVAGIQVVGSARSGEDALRVIPQLQPDVVTLDIEMPGLDGLSTLRRIMADYPRPVIMLSSLTQHGANETIAALAAGAFDFVPKPAQKAAVQEVMEETAKKILAAKKSLYAAPSRLQATKPVTTPLAAERPAPRKASRRDQRGEPVLLIGASTGGPRALHTLLPALPGDLPAAVVVVQHMPAGFTHSLAQRIDSLSALHVREAENGDRPALGQVLIAPGGFHLRFDENHCAALSQDAPVHGVRPAIDVSLQSLVQLYGSRLITVILTGMGSDGTYGAGLVRQAGGMVLAEAESTCAVWGMPRSVTEAGYAQRITPLNEMSQAIQEVVEMKIRGNTL